MACALLKMQNPNLNVAMFSCDTMPLTCSIGQVPLRKAHEISSARQSVAASSSVAPANNKVEAAGGSVAGSCLASVWRELHGLNNWEGLVEPLDTLLRHEIIRYGEFVTACYKAFDLNPASKRYLNCKYGKKSMLSQVGLCNSGYEVTKYIYATPDVSIPMQNGTSCGRWVGYVAISSDDESRALGRRDVVVTFRGTVTNFEWIANFMSSLTPARLDPHNRRPDVKVESGFLSLYTFNESECKFGLGSCREQLLSEISRILNKYRGEDISITLAGHSMGSALAMLLAYDIAELGLCVDNKDQKIQVTVFSFGGPRVGNSGFKERCEELGVKVLRIANVNDPITKLPGVVFNENFRVLGGKYEFPWSCSCYAHVGVELVLDFIELQNPSCVHDLEYYISLLKCPKPKELHVGKQGKNILDRAKNLLSKMQSLNTMPWRDAVINAVNLFDFQRT